MADIVSKAVRSRMMSSVRGRNTAPEHVVRTICTGLGARYRLHRRDLPGSPDLVFGPRKLVIFVHGCFWHRHKGCKLATTPKSRIAFWNDKFAKNVARDGVAIRALRRSGWRVEVVWECETRQPERLARRIGKVLTERMSSTCSETDSAGKGSLGLGGTASSRGKPGRSKVGLA